MTTSLVVYIYFRAGTRLLDKRNAIGSLKRDFQIDRKLKGFLEIVFSSQEKKQNKNYPYWFLFT